MAVQKLIRVPRHAGVFRRPEERLSVSGQRSSIAVGPGPGHGAPRHAESRLPVQIKFLLLSDHRYLPFQPLTHPP